MTTQYDDDQPPPEEDFGATTPLIRPKAAERLEPQPEQPAAHDFQYDTTPPLSESEPEPQPEPRYAPQPGPAAPPLAAPAAARRGIPVWVWIIPVFLFLIVVAFVLFFILLRSPGFTMVVRGAPPGSSVFVDNVSRGVTSGDGSINVPGLKAGKRVVRVAHDGYTDFNTSVSGNDGEVKTVIAQLVPAGQQEAAGLPKEIDYNGPMVLVNAGEFVMGDDNHQPDETPAHKLTLPDFYIDRFEVTN